MTNSLLSGPSTVGKFSNNVSPIKNENDESIVSFLRINQPGKKSTIVPRLDLQPVFEIQRMQIRAAEEQEYLQKMQQMPHQNNQQMFQFNNQGIFVEPQPLVPQYVPTMCNLQKKQSYKSLKSIKPSPSISTVKTNSPDKKSFYHILSESAKKSINKSISKDSKSK